MGHAHPAKFIRQPAAGDNKATAEKCAEADGERQRLKGNIQTAFHCRHDVDDRLGKQPEGQHAQHDARQQTIGADKRGVGQRYGAHNRVLPVAGR